jgi:uncharacterized protein (DUF433 family)
LARGQRRKTETARRHMSLRVAQPTFEELERRAREAGEPRSALVERYIAEGLRMDEHPQIYFRQGALGRRAALQGTRLDIWQVIETVRNHGNSVEDAADYLDLPVERVRAAVRYYAAQRDEVDEFAEGAAAAAERAEAAGRAEEEILAS